MSEPIKLTQFSHGYGWTKIQTGLTPKRRKSNT